MKRFLRGIVSLSCWVFSLGFTLLIIGGVLGVLLFNHYSKDLPDHSQLARYDPPTITRLYAGDGRLLAEYAIEKRVFVPLTAIPKHVQNAFLAAEDKNFYAHTGVDITGIARAVRDNIVNYGHGKSLVGGSTITQQVVKNFLLTNEKSIERKIKEAILAVRISQVYSKDKILELYLNEIYLGLSSYGVAAAAQNYFNKSLDDITIDEAALLAAQPKAPSYYNPRINYNQALERRNWVIERMREVGYISQQEATDAKNTAIILRNRGTAEVARADFFAEEVRRWLSEKYGPNVLYEGGLVVKTTLDPQLQKFADQALRKALTDYDRRRGYRGPLANISDETGLGKLSKEHSFHLFDKQQLAFVKSLDAQKATIVFDDGTSGIVPMALLKWTRRILGDGVLGPEVTKPADIMKTGDVIIVAPASDEQKKQLSAADQKRAYDLQQIPEVNGGMVVLDPHTGRVLAMSGGYAYGGTEFNRVTQARRQPGSAFKPFVYLAALENGFTPTTLILDAPVEMSQGAGLPNWKPQNYHDEYLGPTTMREGLEKSRNTMTVRMAQVIGIDKVLEIGKRLGIYDTLQRNFSIVLGSAETPLLRLANAYGILVNGGKRITPSLIERIDDRQGKTIYRRDERLCDMCHVNSLLDVLPGAPPPLPADNREQLVDPRIAYQMVSMLQGVTIRGTGTRAKEIGKIVGGKTGTTNDSNDTWFIGFTPDLVAGVYIGHDRPRTLGKKETGSSVALPAFIDFMKHALADTPNTPFRIPPGIELVKTNIETGMPASEGDPPSKVIQEAFITGTPIYIPGVTPMPAETADTSQREVTDEVVQEKKSEFLIEVTPQIEALPQETVAPPTSGTGALY